MGTTVQDIIVRGLGHSFANRPDTIATAATELLEVVNRATAEMFAEAAEEHPEFFGTTVAVSKTGGGWPRPVGAETVFRLELDDGTEVFEVPYDERDIMAPAPAVYLLGGVYYSAGNSNDPTSGNLLCFLSPAPVLATMLTDQVDTRIPDTYTRVHEYLVAEYLALKDERGQEAAMHQRERESWMSQFLRFLAHASGSRVRRTRIPPRVVTPRPRRAPES